MGDHETIYQYGPLAWFWRALIAGALIGGAISVAFGSRLGQPMLLLIAAVLFLPGAFFGAAVAVRVDRLSDDRIRVWTLLFWRRDLHRGQLGTPRLRQFYEGRSGSMYAPALWVRVHRRLPIYLDLLADIPDRRAFVAVFPVPDAALPRVQRRGS